ERLAADRGELALAALSAFLATWSAAFPAFRAAAAAVLAERAPPLFWPCFANAGLATNANPSESAITVRVMQTSLAGAMLRKRRPWQRVPRTVMRSVKSRKAPAGERRGNYRKATTNAATERPSRAAMAALAQKSATSKVERSHPHLGHSTVAPS